ncbi:UNVERIFIED_CONTAM: Type IV inositol polyphosphate 5-phosphatase 7 [Sesamum radiatum]|uniref:Type IV inositol polyphosphate 5-phosphatase 7 n=1 Tax=Sesamum radiatum TaxID=300843 RepID=A0AAW2SLT1_SESRA
MKDDNSKKSKFSWSKKLVRKWFNIKCKSEEIQADEAVYGGYDKEWRSSFPEREPSTIKKSRTGWFYVALKTGEEYERSFSRSRSRSRRGRGYLDHPQILNIQNYSLFVSTWNVGGKSPNSNMNLDDWLHSAPPADIYVLGFQEIVPLSAGNILGAEDNGPAKKWLALIKRTLNNAPGTSGGSACYTPSPVPDPVVEWNADFEGSTRQNASAFFIVAPSANNCWKFRYCVFPDILLSVRRPPSKTSKGFMCWSRIDGLPRHLTSGQKEGDELRRNADVMEILRKTRFPRVNSTNDEKSPETVLEHDRVIWLGDLNYRIALPHRSAKALVEMQNWRALLEKDQLRIEQRRGRVFDGWREGKIYFPPTYKYSHNSDRYTGDNMHPKEKRRTPAWCDRILWHGGGLQQLSYVRGESRFSDHRPVSSVFWAEIESVPDRLRKSTSCSSSRIEVEELLPYSHSYTELCFF